ncbi:hypothetical protein BDW22DRAFT_388566 [Trametopsis cervina]|nr:hypothetical protein BDW22DRAFT_388566 [Trametopsis cervina]
MMFKAAAVLSLASLVLASPQGYGAPPDFSTPTTSSAPAPAASSSSSGQVLVQVGPNGGFSFSPADITASAGTLVTFVFGASIPHSVTQSTADSPCTPAQGGFSSGLTQGTTFSVNVTDATQPIYFFCEFPAHCGLGMVGTINAPSSGNGSASSFAAAASAIGANEQTVSNTNFVSGGLAAIATAGPTQGTPTVSGASTSPTSGGSSSGASPLAVGNVAALLSAAAAVFGMVLY